MSLTDGTAEQGPDTGYVPLRTERLVLRRFGEDDAAAFAAYRSDPEVARYQSWDVPYTLGQARRFIEGMAELDPDTPGQWFQLAVVKAASGVLLGDVAMLVDGEDPRLATIGMTIAPSAQGGGVATEAVGALLDYLLVARGKHRVVAECDARNGAAVAVLERLGLRREAHHLSSAWYKGEWTDEYVYAVLADEWRRPSRP